MSIQEEYMNINRSYKEKKFKSKGNQVILIWIGKIGMTKLANSMNINQKFSRKKGNTLIKSFFKKNNREEDYRNRKKLQKKIMIEI